ncbi:hypothetical protein [Photobacterium lucens]|nr:hypothetical protein [Photobacterium lucens]
MMLNKLGMFVIDEANAMSSLWDVWNHALPSVSSVYKPSPKS